MRLVPLLLLVALDGVDHPVLPGSRVAPLGDVREPERLHERGLHVPAARGLVRHLPENVLQVVERVHHLADVRLLQFLDARVEREDVVVDDRADRDSVHVVVAMEGVTFDVVGRRAEVKRPALEEHHGDVHPPLASRDHAPAEPLEERLVEAGEVEPRRAVLRRARPTAAAPCRGGSHRPPPAT
jgi:hypothetical protein